MPVNAEYTCNKDDITFTSTATAAAGLLLQYLLEMKHHNAASSGGVFFVISMEFPTGCQA